MLAKELLRAAGELGKGAARLVHLKRELDTLARALFNDVLPQKVDEMHGAAVREKELRGSVLAEGSVR